MLFSIHYKIINIMINICEKKFPEKEIIKIFIQKGNIEFGEGRVRVRGVVHNCVFWAYVPVSLY